jgi:hypothetical protein
VKIGGARIGQEPLDDGFEVLALGQFPAEHHCLASKARPPPGCAGGAAPDRVELLLALACDSHSMPPTLNLFLSHPAGGTAPGAVLFSGVTTTQGGER